MRVWSNKLNNNLKLNKINSDPFSVVNLKKLDQNLMPKNKLSMQS